MPKHISQALEKELIGLVPRWLVGALETQITDEAEVARVSTEGALLFADISGFSKLTNALFQQLGPAGADRLSSILNHYFGFLVEQVRLRGGEVVDFAGDALIAHWPVADADGLPEAIHLAADCARAMCELVSEIPDAEGVKLSLHNAVCAGEITGARLGGRGGRWLIFFGGEVTRQLGPSLTLANDGQTALSPEAVALVGERVQTEVTPEGPGLLLGAAPIDPEAPSRMLTGVASTVAPDRVAAYVYGFIQRRREQGLGRWLAEIRSVSVLFVQITNADGGAPALAELHEAVGQTQEILARYFGEPLGISEDDKGMVLRAAFGLPSSGPFRSGYPVQAALELQDAFEARGLKVGIGVATGKLFCGEVGDALRHKYDLNGNAMNLAARLMQQGGGVLCDEATRRGAEDAVAFEPPQRLLLKGFGDVDVFRALRARQREALDGSAAPLCGRERELLAFEEALSGGGVIVFEGEAGIGKSRLTSEAVARVEAAGRPARIVVADAASRATPYRAWRPLLLQLLGLDGVQDEAASHDATRTALGDRAALAPLLNPALGTSMPETPETEALRGFLRAARTAELIHSLIVEDSAGGAPPVLIIEDSQWLDGASLQVLDQLIDASPSALFLLTTRPLSNDAPPDYRRIIEGAGERRLVLGPLPRTAIQRLLAGHLGVTAVPARLADWIFQRAHGHPFFSLELALALRADGMLRAERGALVRAPLPRELEAFSPPATIEAMVTYRLDRLDGLVQLVLKTCSVVGMVVPLAALRSVKALSSVTDLDAQLDALIDADVLDRSNEDVFVFRHRITQEIAYGLLVAAQKRAVHSDLARWYATRGGDQAATLARHWGGAEEYGQALKYLELCYSGAAQSGSMSDALRFAQDVARLDTTAGGRSPLTPLDRGRWQRRLSEAGHGTGAPALANKHGRQALAALGTQLPEEKKDWGRYLLRQLLLHVVIQFLPRPFWRAKEEQIASICESARAMSFMAASFYYLGGNPLAMLAAATAATNLTQRARRPLPVTTSFGILSMTAAGLGRERIALYYLRLARENADGWGTPRELSNAWLSHVAVHCAACRWEENERVLDEALPLLRASRSGYLTGPFYTMLGFNDYASGKLERSRRRAHEIRALAERHQNPLHRGWGLYLEAMIQLARGALDEALELAEQSELLLDPIQDLSRFNAKGVRALALLRSGDADAAREVVDGYLHELKEAPLTSFTRLEGYAAPAEVYLTLGDAEAGEDALAVLKKFARLFKVGQPRMGRLQAKLALLREDTRSAARLLDDALQSADALNMPLERAWLLELRSTTPDGDPAAMEEARAIFAEMGCSTTGTRAGETSP